VGILSDEELASLRSAENERLRAALEFYADPESWGWDDYAWNGEDEYPMYAPGDADRDRGDRAREALKGGGQ